MNLPLAKVNFTNRDAKNRGICCLKAFGGGFVSLLHFFFLEIDAGEAGIGVWRRWVSLKNLLIFLDCPIEVALAEESLCLAKRIGRGGACHSIRPRGRCCRRRRGERG